MPTKRGKPAAAGVPLLSPKDVRTYIREKAAIIAPADVEALLGQEVEILERAAAETTHPLLRRQSELAVRILQDHASGAAPQIPYFTISLIAVALFYFLDKSDAIPDWIPKVGTSDDALVLELAFEMGASGVQRYCDFKGISSQSVLPPIRTKPGRPPRAR